MISQVKSIRHAHENCTRKPQGAYLWIVSADCMHCYAITITKRIRNYLKMLAVHFYVPGRGKAEVLNPCTGLGT
jgi:hypothetical protein